jgi:hypothetical protein
VLFSYEYNLFIQFIRIIYILYIYSKVTGPTKPKYVKYDTEKNMERKNGHSSNNDHDGVSIDHVMASGTFPEFYDYKQIDGRKFWDGGLLSNTPFRELLQAH